LLTESFCKKYLFSVTSLWCSLVNPFVVVRPTHILVPLWCIVRTGWRALLCSSSAYRAPCKKAAVPIYKVLVRPGRKSNFRPTSNQADALTTRPRAGEKKRAAVTNWVRVRSKIILNLSIARLFGSYSQIFAWLCVFWFSWKALCWVCSFYCHLG